MAWEFSVRRAFKIDLLNKIDTNFYNELGLAAVKRKRII